MTIEEFSKMYYPTKEQCEQIALGKIVSDFANPTYSRSILNSLYRGGIFSISDLYKASEDQIKKIRNVGEKKVSDIMEIKDIIESRLS